MCEPDDGFASQVVPSLHHHEALLNLQSELCTDETHLCHHNTKATFILMYLFPLMAPENMAQEHSNNAANINREMNPQDHIMSLKTNATVTLSIYCDSWVMKNANGFTKEWVYIYFSC